MDAGDLADSRFCGSDLGKRRLLCRDFSRSERTSAALCTARALPASSRWRLVREDDYRAAGFAELACKPAEFLLRDVRVLPLEVFAFIRRAVAAEAGIENDEGHATGFEVLKAATGLRVSGELLLGECADAVLAQSVVPGDRKPSEVRFHGLEPFDSGDEFRIGGDIGGEHISMLSERLDSADALADDGMRRHDARGGEGDVRGGNIPAGEEAAKLRFALVSAH